MFTSYSSIMSAPPWATPAPSQWQAYDYYPPERRPVGSVFVPTYHSPYHHSSPHSHSHPHRAHAEPSRRTSPKYPTLHPILASDTTLLRFDVSIKPRSSILASTFYSNSHQPATTNGATYLRLVSKSFPWTIDIRAAENAPTGILCETVWDAIYVALQIPVEDSEWGLIVQCGAKKQRENMEKAATKRMEAEHARGHVSLPGVHAQDDKRIKRIDYLGDATLFKGLEKDEEFVKQRLMPGDKGCSDTWVVKLT